MNCHLHFQDEKTDHQSSSMTSRADWKSGLDTKALALDPIHGLSAKADFKVSSARHRM